MELFLKLQPMLTSDDEEESASLAEPVILEGAKQLAQTTPTPPTLTPPLPHTLTPPLAHALHSNVSPPALTSPTSLHHPLSSHPSSPGLCHHSAIHQSSIVPHPLSSPPSNELWPPSTSRISDHPVNEDNDLPSTVDLQAIRVRLSTSMVL